MTRFTKLWASRGRALIFVLMTGDTTSPTKELFHPDLEKAQIGLWVKREDLLHPEISGNKWRKLKYNLTAAKRGNYECLLSFGGAYSNHLLALAAAGKELGFRTIGVVRGEEHKPLNPTLQRCSELGMVLHYIDRTSYREKHLPKVIQPLQEQWGPAYLIPEGGSNSLGVAGCREILDDNEVPFDVVACACGTGATFAGLADNLPSGTKAVGFPVLKGGEFLREAIGNWLGETWHEKSSWDLDTSYHFGGYAEYTDELIQFLGDFQRQQGFALDPIYTGKFFYGLFDRIRQGHFAPGTRILAIHTGGLQGIAGFQERFEISW